MTDPADAGAQAIVARVQSSFERVQHERMAGLPFLNEALRVELVGLRRWRGLWLGVLVTPWFMNLLLLPGDGVADGDEVPARWPAVRTGEYAPFAFPAAVLSFLAGREAEVGDYLSCSLFSPVFEFADHDAARQTAQACLAALFDSATAVPPPAAVDTDRAAPADPAKRAFLQGRWSGAGADTATPPVPR